MFKPTGTQTDFTRVTQREGPGFAQVTGLHKLRTAITPAVHIHTALAVGVVFWVFLSVWFCFLWRGEGGKIAQKF